LEVQLKPWSLDDIPDIARHANNPNIACNLRDAFPHPYTLADAEHFVSGCIGNDGIGQLCRAVVADGAVVGSIGLFLGSDVSRKSAELGYWLAEEFWGRGMMSAAVRQLCAEGFTRFDLARIYAEPFAYNIGSRRVLEHAGFSLEGILKNSVFKKGRLLDSCVYALLCP